MGKVKFGALVKHHRAKKGWTQAQLAEALGYPSPQFVSLLERDQSKVPLYVLGQFVVLLGIPEAELMKALIKSYRAEVLAEISKGKKMAAGH